MIKRALWLGKPQYSSDFPASYLSPPWEGPGRLCKFGLPSLGGVGGGLASYHSPPWEGSGEVMQVSTPLPWGGVGGGFLLFSFTNAFAGRGVLKSKRITVGNTRVLSLFATH